MDKLFSAIKNTDLIKDEKIFEKKYQIIQAYFRLNALLWAVKSDNPSTNIQELVEQWNKKGVKWKLLNPGLRDQSSQNAYLHLVRLPPKTEPAGMGFTAVLLTFLISTFFTFLASTFFI